MPSRLLELVDLMLAALSAVEGRRGENSDVRRFTVGLADS